MHLRSHSLRLLCLALFVGGLALLGSIVTLLRTPLPVHAQAAPDLVVTLRDGAGAGIAGATITVHDRDGEGVLALSQTDVTGTVTITSVLMSDVRVAVTGKASDGTVLKHLDTDTGGIALFLDGARTTQLDLRVEDDGTVIPDPQTMLVPETVPSTAAPAVPTVIAVVSSDVIATVQPTAPLFVMASPAQAAAEASTQSPASSSPALQVVAVIGSLVLLALVGQLAARVVRNWRHP